MKKPVMLVVFAAVVVVSVWSWRRTGASEADSQQLFADRIWLDHVPRSDKDTIQAFVAISEHSVGAFQATSMWRGGFEAFRYEAHAGELRALYPQTGDREAIRVKAKRCNEQGMDYCLELDGASRGVKRYYSRKGWEIEGAHDLDAAQRRIDAVRDQLVAAH
jgi:hypothetical protein